MESWDASGGNGIMFEEVEEEMKRKGWRGRGGKGCRERLPHLERRQEGGVEEDRDV